MKPITPYLFFNGNCREAMEFYRQCFGGTLEVMTYGDAPDPACNQADKDAVIHACLTDGEFTLMASDNPMSKPVTGDHLSLSIHCESREQTDRLFAAVGKDGTVTMALADTFWDAYFGMVVDKYGFHWMFNCPNKKG